MARRFSRRQTQPIDGRWLGPRQWPKHWIIGGATAVAMEVPTVAIVLWSWFGPNALLTPRWMELYLSTGILLIFGFIILAAVFGAVAAELRGRRGLSDSRSALQAVKSGLLAFFVFNLGRFFVCGSTHIVSYLSPAAAPVMLVWVVCGLAALGGFMILALWDHLRKRQAEEALETPASRAADATEMTPAPDQPPAHASGGRFDPWLIGATTALILETPHALVTALGWFIELPITPPETLWQYQDAAVGREPVGAGLQTVALIVLLAVSAAAGGIGSETRSRLKVPDRHPAASAIRGGLLGWIGLAVTIGVLGMVAFPGRTVGYMIFGPGAETANHVGRLFLFLALIFYFLLADDDIWFARLVWRIAPVPADAMVQQRSGPSIRKWSLWQIGTIVACLVILTILRTQTVPHVMRAAQGTPESSWQMVSVLGWFHVGALVAMIVALGVWLRGYRISRQEEQQTAATSLRAGTLARRPVLAAVLVACVVGLAASLVMRSRLLEPVEAPVAEQLLLYRLRIGGSYGWALEPDVVFQQLPVTYTRPAGLAWRIQEIQDENRAVIVHVSFADLKIGAGGLRRPPGWDADRPASDTYDAEMQYLAKTLQEAANVFFLVDGSETNPRRHGLPFAQTGWFEAEGGEGWRPFRAQLYSGEQEPGQYCLPALVAARVLGISDLNVFSGRHTKLTKLRIGSARILLDKDGTALISGREDPTIVNPSKLKPHNRTLLPPAAYQRTYLGSPSTFSSPETQQRLRAFDATLDALIAETIAQTDKRARHILAASRVIRPAPGWLNIVLLWAFCLWGAFMSVLFRPWHAAALLVYLVGLIITAAALLATLFNMLVNPTMPVLAMLAVWISGTHINQAIVERHRDQVRGVFGRYVTQQVADEMLNREETVLGGERRRVTVLFADIRGFGLVAEHLGPDELVALLNEHFSVMVDAIFEFNGTLDKFIGDAVMAVWGAPVEHTADAANAVRAAVTIRDNTNELAKRREAEGKPVVSVAMGLSTGDVVAGNIGDIRRMEYTVIGDSVNVAARLQEIASRSPAYILISAETYALVRNLCRARSLGPVEVRHREEPVEIYEVLDLR